MVDKAFPRASKLRGINILETVAGKKTIKFIKEYEDFLAKELAKGDLRKTPTFKKWVTSKYGEAAYRTIETVVYKSSPKLALPQLHDAKDILLGREVAEANKGDKYLSMRQIFKKSKSGYVRSEPLEKKYIPLLETEADKIRKVFDKIVENDEVIKWPSNYSKKGSRGGKGNIRNPLQAMIHSRSGAGSGGQYITQVLEQGKTSRGEPIKMGLYKPKHTFPKDLLRLAGHTGVIHYEKPFSEIIAEAKYRKGGGVVWSSQVLAPDPATTINDFALRHWNIHKRNKTPSQIEIFWKNKFKNGKPAVVEWEKIPEDKFGRKSLKASQVYFTYDKDPNKTKWDLNKLRKDGKQSNLFPEVYDAKKEYNKLLAKKVPDPKTGKTITFEELMKRTYQKGFGFSPHSPTYALDHEKLVAEKPFNALRVVSQRLNNQLGYISRFAKQKNFKKILMNALDLTEVDDPLTSGQNLAKKVLVEGYKNPLTAAQDLGQTVLKKDLDKLSRPMVNQLVNLFSRSTNRKIVEPILEAAALDANNICEVVFGPTGVRFSKANGGTGCAAEMEDALNQKPVQTLKKIEQIPSKPGMVNTIQNTAKKVLNILPKLGTVGKIGTVAAGAGIALSGLRFNPEKGEIVNTNTDQKADQNQILEYVKDNPLKVTAGTSLGFAAQEVPGAYKAARNLGRGRIRSTLGISGALKPILTTFGTPLMTGLYEGAIGAKRLEEGETMTDVLTDPLGPALGISLMEPLTRMSGVVRDAKPVGILGGLKRAFNPFDMSNVGTARPGLTSKILRMGMSPRVIAGISRLGPYGMLAATGLSALDQYNKYQNQEGMIYNFLNN